MTQATQDSFMPICKTEELSFLITENTDVLPKQIEKKSEELFGSMIVLKESSSFATLLRGE